jgi:peptide/nickel transport system substrate-binding protein
MKKSLTVLLLVALLALSAAPSSGAETRTLTLSTLAPLTTIDPHATLNIQDLTFHRQIFEPLLYQNEATGTYEPRIAESYSISGDHLTYTFAIRKGVKFHNGEELKASDVVFSLKRAADNPRVRSYMTGVTDVSADGDYTVVVKLGQPNAAFLNNQGMVMIVSQKEVEEQGGEFGTKLTLAGTGPFYLTSLKHDVEWTCSAFPDYYRGEADIKKIHYVPIVEASAGRGAHPVFAVAPALVGAAHIAHLAPHPERRNIERPGVRKTERHRAARDFVHFAAPF